MSQYITTGGKGCYLNTDFPKVLTYATSKNVSTTIFDYTKKNIKRTYPYKGYPFKEERI